MARFLLEVPHEAVACARAAQIFLNAGSHFLTHADWGCTDGEHKAWILVEAVGKQEARGILPPSMRSQAKIVKLNYFTLEEIDAILRHHHVSVQQPNQWHARREGGAEMREASQ